LIRDQNYGKPHRDGGRPAIIWPDGSRRWYKNDIETRELSLSDLSLACALRKRLGRVDTEWVRAFAL